MELITNRLTIRSLCPDDWIEIKEIWRDFDKSAYAQYDAPHSNNDTEIQKLVKHFSESIRI